MTWRRAWALILLICLGLETAALIRRGDGDTLTEQVRPWIRAHRIAAAAGVIWLIYHFFLAH